MGARRSARQRERREHDVTAVYRPAAEWELASLIADANAKSVALEIAGNGTKRDVGRPFAAGAVISTTGMRGIPLYEPSELVMSAQAGTLLADVERELATRGQMLPFEPADLGPLLGGEAQAGTIGAVFATNISGARRITAGSARDHLLGVKAVTGRGEIVRAGGRVMKNVTGLDVGRALTGSWGTLAVMSEVTFKVVPVPEHTGTLVIFGLNDDIAGECLCRALGTPYEVSGAVHLQEPLARRLWHPGLRSPGRALTAVRLETFASFMPYRVERLKKEIAHFGDIHVIDHQNSLAFWAELRQLSVLQQLQTPLWRISTAPRTGPRLVASVGRYLAAEAFYDWSGGLVWLLVPDSADAGAADIRRVIATHGGHATLVRASAEVRGGVDVFQPLEPGIERLSRKIKATFDPNGILNPARMHAL
jgi:glycolate oxidase FAD binding subunit